MSSHYFIAGAVIHCCCAVRCDGKDVDEQRASAKAAAAALAAASISREGHKGPLTNPLAPSSVGSCFVSGEKLTDDMYI